METQAASAGPQRIVRTLGDKRPTLVICGNGASAVALLQAVTTNPDMPFRIIVIGTGEPGEGLAYATRNPGHLLNTPAGRMSIDPGEPDQFVQWLQKHNLWSPDWANQFVPRRHYADYLQASIARIRARPGADILFLREAVISLTRNQASWRVAHASGQIDADFVVLATGNDMPSPLAPRLAPALRHLVVDNPWKLPPMGQDERILILGTGLTAVDTVLMLADKGHRGNLSLLSRHGLLPRTHVPPQDIAALAQPFPDTAIGMLRTLRQAAGIPEDHGSWQGLFDAMRPHWAQIWQQLPLNEQRRFLRHGATIWNMHRHRVAPQVARRIHQLLGANACLLKGRLAAMTPSGDGAAAVSIRHGGAETLLAVDRVINCMGPNSDPEKTHNRLIENIVASRQARTAASGIGLDITDDNRVIGHDGLGQPSLFAMGSLTRGKWWEVTAMPEIVRQARGLAESLQTAHHRNMQQYASLGED